MIILILCHNKSFINRKNKMKRYTNSKILKEDIKSGRIKNGEAILIDERKMYSDRIELTRAYIGVFLIALWMVI